MKTIDYYNFFNKRALVRFDFNVPIDNNLKILDSTRIKLTLPTIKKIINDGGKVIIISHLGNPKGLFSKKYSLYNVSLKLSYFLGFNVKLISNFIDDIEIENFIKKLDIGDVVLLENIRFYKEEYLNSKNFAFKLSKFGDIFVNDAFSVSHRKHSSVVAISSFFSKKCFGYLMEKEISSINKFLKNVNHPATVILGGSKVSSKIKVIKNISSKIDYFLIGGAMSFTFIKSLGGNIGNSFFCKEDLIISSNILKEIKKNKLVKFYLPLDFVCGDKFSNDCNIKVFNSNYIKNGWMGLDIGPLTLKMFINIINISKTIFWNGPLGVFEFKNFSKGTNSIAKSISELTYNNKNKVFSLIGGGDSISSIKNLNLYNKISYISTGGGAMLTFLSGEKLFGIDSIIE